MLQLTINSPMATTNTFARIDNPPCESTPTKAATLATLGGGGDGPFATLVGAALVMWRTA